jgi:hypothetical protein
VEGSAVPVAAAGSTDERPGFIENPRPEIPSP